MFQAKIRHGCIKYYFPVKVRIFPPYLYLGANVEKVNLEGVQVVWSTSCVDYLNISIENVNNALGVDKTALNNYGDMHRP